MNDEQLVVVRWLLGAECDPVPDGIVPGTSSNQRRVLAALGGLVASAGSLRSLVPALAPAIGSWLTADVEVPAHVRDAFLRGVRSSSGPAYVASVYESCVANVNRRHLGTFFTPAVAVDEMLDSWDKVASPPTTVIDIGAGVGAFSLAAVRRWPTATVLGVDVNPVTLGLLGLLAAEHGVPVQWQSQTRAGLCLALEDFMTWSRGYRHVKRPRLLLGNPPFTRLQLLHRCDRERFTRHFGGRVGSRASLAIWILARSLELMDPADGLALLLPAYWLEADYAAPIRERIRGMTNRKVCVKLLGGDVFPDASVDAVSLLIGPVEPVGQTFVVSHFGAEVTLRRYGPNAATFRPRRMPSAPKTGLPLSDIASTRRGTATGANAFFLLSESERRELDLPLDHLRPLLRRPNIGRKIDADGLALLPDNIPRWILFINGDEPSHPPQVQEYLHRGELLGVDGGVLCVRRKHWFDLRHDLVTPSVALGPITRSEFAVIESDDTIAIANNLYGLIWRPEVLEEARSRVIAWLRSAGGQEQLRDLARHHGHNLYKLEPSALRRLIIPEAVVHGRGDARPQDT